jgi:predicted small secreted protein
MRAIKAVMLLVLLGVGTVGLAACDNTIRGIRGDIEETGDAVSGN